MQWFPEPSKLEKQRKERKECLTTAKERCGPWPAGSKVPPRWVDVDVGVDISVFVDGDVDIGVDVNVGVVWTFLICRFVLLFIK